jgi:hypothetical protein
VLADGTVVGRIFKANASPVDASWMWTLAFGYHEDRRDGGIRKELAGTNDI